MVATAVVDVEPDEHSKAFPLDKKRALVDRKQFNCVQTGRVFSQP